MMKNNPKNIFGGCSGTPKSPFLTFLGVFRAPKHPLKKNWKYFSSSYNFLWAFSFPGLLYFAFCNDFKGFNDNFRFVGKKLSNLHVKFAKKIFLNPFLRSKKYTSKYKNKIILIIYK